MQPVKTVKRCGHRMWNKAQKKIIFSSKTRTLLLVRKSLTVFDASFISGTMRTMMLLWKLKWGKATSSSHRHFTAISAKPLYAFNEMTLLFFNFLCFQSAQNNIFSNYCSKCRGSSTYSHFLLLKAFLHAEKNFAFTSKNKKSRLYL